MVDVFGGIFSVKKSDRSFNSTATQTILNSSTVSMFQDCDSNFSNVVSITITGDNNIIDNLWINQNITWSVECIADFFNGRDYYNEMESKMIDLANTGIRNLSLFGILDIPLPDWATDTTVNTEQIQTIVNQFFSQFNQDCSTDVQNLFEFEVDGNLNLLTNVTVDQMANGMTDCYFSATNQETVSNQMLATVDGSSQDGLSGLGWIIIIAIIVIVLIIIIVIIVAIVRAASGGNNKESDMGGNESYPSDNYSSEYGENYPSSQFNEYGQPDFNQYNYDTGTND